MSLLQQFWEDESGVILSAEAVVVGTVAVLGVSAGLSVVATAVNEELKDVGFAIRSLDQSYEFPGQISCKASTTGSSFQQQSVKESLNELCDFREQAARHEASESQERQKRRGAEKQRHDKSESRANSKRNARKSTNPRKPR